MDEWTEVAWLESEGGAFKAELARTLHAFLAERGMSRNEIADNDIRVDLVYLGPAKGRCARRLLVRTAALLDERAETPGLVCSPPVVRAAG